MQGSEAYHRDCYKELFHPKCEVCHNFVGFLHSSWDVVKLTAVPRISIFIFSIQV